MRVLVYDELGDVALDYDTRTDMVPLCPGRLEKAQVVEALQEGGVLHHGRTSTHVREPHLSTVYVRGGRR